MDLSKPDKKIARALIDKGLEVAYEAALSETYDILKNWKSQKLDDRTAYMELYKVLNSHDHGIARRYNGLGGSRYFSTVLSLFLEEVLDQKDIEGFSDEVKNKLLLSKKSFEE
ncbi:MAG: hypothetical protein KA143_02890 [Saprospiraceae bacterium]|nr:hypothetical protein [Saprospiraceae bacterium]